MTMSALEEHNLKSNNVISIVKELASAISYDSVRVRYILSNVKTEWYNVICAIRAFTPEEVIKKQSEYRKYGNIIIAEEWIQYNDLEVFIERLSEGKIDVEDREIQLSYNNQNWRKKKIPSYNEYSQYPGYLFSFEFEKAPISYSEPLINYKFPYFSDLFDAIKDWAEIKDFHDYNDSRVGSVFIILPDNRLHFENIELDKNYLKLSTDSSYLRRPNSIIRGSYTYKNIKNTFEAKPSRGKVKIYIGDQKPEQIELWLIGPNNQIYDFYFENQYYGKSQRRILKDSLDAYDDVKIVEDAISQGEGPNIEFKPFIDTKHHKVEELIRTAIAFANTSGGNLYLGINDSCIIVGVEKEIRKSLGRNRSDIEKVYEEYNGTLKQILNDHLNNSLNFEIKKIEIFEKVVIAIKIPEGINKPYYNIENNSIYIRRGANSVIANPEHDLPKLYQSRKSIP